MTDKQWPQRVVTGFHKDKMDDWVADLECGHGRHVRHNPPWQNRSWVITEAGRKKIIGESMACRKCTPINSV